MIKAIHQKLSGLIFPIERKLPVINDYFTQEDILKFKLGECFNLHEKMGAHLIVHQGQEGIYFCVWAPNAKQVSVIGGFNGWKSKTHLLTLRGDRSGIWEGFYEGVKKGDLYKFCVFTSLFGKGTDKADPYALFCEQAPKTASVVWALDYKWNDDEWLNGRKDWDWYQSPVSIYEVHLGSWRRRENGEFKSYRELADELVSHIKEMNFTHVEFMPVTEHPFYGSWGYQALGYFASTSRYGEPEELMVLIDRFHQEGIGVILDWVPSHFPCDSSGLAQFDGTSLYEMEGYHPEWQSAIFNNGSNQVIDFLISNALFWIEKFHIDGLRVDAVASMLYLDYARKKGEWDPNIFGGKENLESVAFLRKLNEVIKSRHKDVLMIAEESTSWPNISRPLEVGGLGFDMKWNMGWMHDTLKYFKESSRARLKKNNKLTFSLFYAFNENFILSLSHDEVVYEKSSLLGKMPGKEAEKFDHLKCLYGYMYAHPGKKLLFMGAELAQWNEWDHDAQLDWELLKYPEHQFIKLWLKDLNKLYQDCLPLYELDFSKEGFDWVDLGSNKNGVFSFLRKSSKTNEKILVVCNLSNMELKDYCLNIPFDTDWEFLISSDDEKYGGRSSQEEIKVKKLIIKEEEKSEKEAHQYVIDLSPSTVHYFRSQ